MILKQKPSHYSDELYDRFEVPKSLEPEIEPYAGGLRFELPEGLGNPELAALGLLDVTAAPFCADNTGKRDCTAALNEAMRTAQRYQLVCYFPLGTYRVSDTLHACQDIWWEGYPFREYRVGARTYPIVLLGERREEGGRTLRPEILLAPHSPGFCFPKVHKALLFVYRGSCPELNSAPGSICNMVTGLRFTIGEGNTGAIGVHFYAAQGCSIEDCEIDVGDGYCGIFGSAGNGGSHSQNIIRGGRVGIDIANGTPGSVLEGFVFDHQREYAISAGAKQAVTFVGCRILTGTDRPPVVSFGGTFELMEQGQLSMIDSVIAFDAPPEKGLLQAAVSSRESLYLRHVYVKNATHAVLNPDGTQAPANPEGWCEVEEFAHGIDSMPMWGGVYSAPVYQDGKKLDTRTLCRVRESGEPPETLWQKHRYHLPLWQEVREMNVKTRYGAAGDGIADDTAALQRAIDEQQTVFLPKGYYRITDTLRLRADTKLVGVAQNLSQIIVTQSPDGAFADETREAPALLTPDKADASVMLCYAGVVTARKLTHVYALHWRCAGGSMLRNFAFYGDPGYRITWMTRERHTPWIRITGSGGGRWYNFWCDITQGGAGYRILKISGTRQPLRIYACNVEHSRSEYEMEIDGCKNIEIYGLKSECNAADLLIKDSENIALFSKGGDASAPEGKALLYLENSRNILLTLLNDYRVTQGHGMNFYSGYWYPASLWHMVEERSEQQISATGPWERPVYYASGRYTDIG